MRTRIFVSLVLLLAVVPAMAVDYWQGPPAETWVRNDNGTTFEHWNFVLPGNEVPEVFENPYGTPFSEFPEGTWEWGDAWICPLELDPNGAVDGWHCTSPEGGAVLLYIPNTTIPDGTKYIFLQVTSSKGPSSVTAAGQGPGYSAGTWQTGRPQIQWPGPAPFGGVWYTYNYGLWIYPNPAGEVIRIEVPECTVVDQIVVDTICTTVPVAAHRGTWSELKALFRD